MDRRPSAAARGYDRRWRRLRRRVLAEEPVCRDPDGRHPNEVVAAVHVDHIIPRRNGGTDARENLQALCPSCHSYKTAIENKPWNNRA